MYSLFYIVIGLSSIFLINHHLSYQKKIQKYMDFKTTYLTTCCKKGCLNIGDFWKKSKNNDSVILSK